MDENERSAFEVYRQQQEENEVDSEELCEDFSVIVSRYVSLVVLVEGLTINVRHVRFHVSAKSQRGEVPRRRDEVKR